MWSGLKKGLSKTHDSFLGKIDGLFKAKKIDADILEGLEEALITSDIGVESTLSILDKLPKQLRGSAIGDEEAVKKGLRELILDILKPYEASIETNAEPYTIMVVGVNGVGKTTTIGKLAWYFRGMGKRVLLGAADTFRAAATEQLEIWGERTGIDVIKQRKGADPGAVAFDAVQAAKARSSEVLIVDTAGRIHTKVNLMEEMKKMKRVMARELEGAPHEILLVLDATTGQNALSQAKAFHETLGLTGLIVTKLDGTARGGIVISIVEETKIPIKFIGLGEGMEDLRPFNAGEFVEALI